MLSCKPFCTVAPMLIASSLKVKSLTGAFALAFALGLPALADESVATYHGNPDRSGNFTVPSLTVERAARLHADADFKAGFAGHVYAQPLYWRGLVIAVTEDNTVEALDAKTGRSLWHRALGGPVARGTLSCGNIDPLGITGTPVIDEGSGTLYADAFVAAASGPRHQIFALSLKDGSVIPGWPVDVAGVLETKGQTFIARDQNERGALGILNGRVYVPFGGHFGDCGQYRGWVVGLSMKDPKDAVFWATRARGGGIWAPGGISSDGVSLFVSTGNTFGASSWADGESVIRLAPNLKPSDRREDYFAPSDWQSLDSRDLDLGGANPLPLDLAGRHFLLALGKDGRAYLLDRNNLGGIGGALAMAKVSDSAIRGAPAAFAAAGGMFVAFQGTGIQCPSRSGNGLVVLKISVGATPSISTAWCASSSGRGSPIVTTTDGRSNPIVWIVGAEGDNRLRGYNGETGAPLFNGGGAAEEMTGIRRFETPIAVDGHLYVPADGRIYAFAF